MDYKAIKVEYETTKTSFKKLSDKYKTHYKALERRAKKEGWIKFSPKQTTPTPITSSIPITKSQIAEDSIQVSEEIKEFLKIYYKPIDNMLVMAYIDSYTAFRELQEEIRKEGRFILSSKGNQYMNPKYSALQMEKTNLIKIGKELGMTLAMRIKLKLDVEEISDEPTISDLIKDVLNEDF
jgi:P27 family predicted phage terminase small subunit